MHGILVFHWAKTLGSLRHITRAQFDNIPRKSGKEIKIALVAKKRVVFALAPTNNKNEPFAVCKRNLAL